MAREKTWEFVWGSEYFSPASALDLHRYTLWFIAATLTGNFGGMSGAGLWTVHASSDSVTAGTDSTDRWQLAGPYDGTKIVRGVSSAAHSWIVLKSPVVNGSNWYMIISFNTSSDVYVKIAWSKDAPTGGSTTATPYDSSTGWNAYCTAFNYGSAFLAEMAFSPSTAQPTRLYMSLADDGQFFFHALRRGQTWMTHTIWFCPLTGYRATEQYPVQTWAAFNETGIWRYDNTVAYPQAAGPISNDFQGTANFAIGRGSTMRNFDGSTPIVRVMMSPTFISRGALGQQASSAHLQILYVPSDGTILDFPAFIIWAGANTAANYSYVPPNYVGRIKDLSLNFAHPGGTQGQFYCATNTPLGSTMPATGSVEYVVIGQYNFPAPDGLDFT